VVVGAGLAGLVTTRQLCAAGVETVLLEAADAPGGRVRTDRVDDMLLDRGFQIFLPAYPQAARTWDLDALRLRSFDAGIAVCDQQGRHVAADPRRMPGAALSTLTLPVGSLREKAALARWLLESAYLPARTVKRRADVSLGDGLRRRRMAGPLATDVLGTFLAGVLGEDQLGTSLRYTELVVRCFVRGDACVPAEGMQALPRQIAAALPDGVLRCDTPVRALDGTAVRTDEGTLRARAVVVATDPLTAAELSGIPRPRMRGLSTYYHLAPEAPTARPLLHIDAARRGPVVNSIVLSNAAPLYAPGRNLVASSVLGSDEGLEPEVRRHAGLLYGVDTSRWQHVRTYAIEGALPDLPAGTPLTKPVDLGGGRFVAGDHRDTPSIQGAVVSGRRAAAAVLRRLGPAG
jgi:monoamine oxidase